MKNVFSVCSFCWGQTKSARIWAHGLLSAVSGAVAADFSAYLVDHKDFSFTPENFAKLKALAGYGAILAVASYFAKSPLSTPTEKS